MRFLPPLPALLAADRRWKMTARARLLIGILVGVAMARGIVVSPFERWGLVVHVAAYLIWALCTAHAFVPTREPNENDAEFVLRIAREHGVDAKLGKMCHECEEEAAIDRIIREAKL